MKTLTEKLARFTIELNYGDIPPSALEAAKRLLFDSIGCALGGLLREDPAIYRDLVEFLGSNEQATILGTTKKVSVVDAALVNSLLTRVMDFNDIYWNQDPSHPSDLIPVALALGEYLDRDGAAVLTAIVIGYELEMRLCDFAVPGLRERGWHHATLTQFASPFMAGKLLGLGEKELAAAAGISGSAHCTLGAVTAGELTMMKNTVDPLAAASGVTAALLAARGYTGPRHVLDGKEGLMQVLGEGWEPESLLAGLGEDFKIEKCGMKAYPTEALTHSPITAALSIIKERGIEPGRIKGIEAFTIERAADILSDPSKYNPTSKETADHSLPYCLAAAFARGRVTEHEFTESSINDEGIRRILPLIKVKADPGFESLFPAKQPSRVVLETTDGERFESYTEYPKGHPENPMGMDELKTKFSALASSHLAPARVDEVWETIENLESPGALRTLLTLLAGENGT